MAPPDLQYDGDIPIDEDYYARFDLLMHATTPEAFLIELQQVWKDANIAGKARFARAYFGLTRARIRELWDIAPYAVAHARTSTPPHTDPRLYDLFAAVEVLHDFKRESVARIECGNEVPAGFDELVWPEIDDVEERFIGFLASQRWLAFPSGTILNPLYGRRLTKTRCNLRRYLARHPEATKEDILNYQGANFATQMRNRTERPLVAADVLTTMDGNEAKLEKMIQVASVIHAIGQQFEDLPFLLDARGNNMGRAILGIMAGAQAMFQHFVIDPTVVAQLATLPDRVAFAIYWARRNTIAPRWTVYEADASWFDPAVTKVRGASSSRGGPYMDVRPTQDVFMPREGRPQVVLTGVDLAQSRVLFEIVDPPMTYKASMGKRESSNYVSINRLARVADQVRKPSGPLPSPYTLKDVLPRLSHQALFALKRAGDWGMVEHCRRYRMVFITKDKMAAMYAYLRGAPCIFLQDELIKSHHVFRYSFVMARPTLAGGPAMEHRARSLPTGRSHTPSGPRRKVASAGA